MPGNSVQLACNLKASLKALEASTEAAEASALSATSGLSANSKGLSANSGRVPGLSTVPTIVKKVP